MYLKSCLRSHASKPIMNLETTESNYEVALQKKDSVNLSTLLSRVHGFTAVRAKNMFQLLQPHPVFNETWLFFKTVFKPAKNIFQYDSVQKTRSMATSERKNFVTSNRICFNCLLPDAASSNVIQHYCARHVKRNIIQLFVAILVSTVLISQPQ